MSEQITKEDPAPASCASGCKDGYSGTANHGTAIPEGPTERILALKRQYMSWKPSITTHRAKAMIRDLSSINFEIAQMVVSAQDNKVLPDWFMLEIIRDLPRLAIQIKN